MFALLNSEQIIKWLNLHPLNHTCRKMQIMIPMEQQK
jgi:hypothetical protein